MRAVSLVWRRVGLETQYQAAVLETVIPRSEWQFPKKTHPTRRLFTVLEGHLLSKGADAERPH